MPHKHFRNVDDLFVRHTSRLDHRFIAKYKILAIYKNNCTGYCHSDKDVTTVFAESHQIIFAEA